MSSAGKLLFLIGLGASYRISLIGQIGISEILVFLWAPFIFAEEFPILRRNGFGTYFLFLFLAFVGCIISSIINHTHIAFFLRGFAQIYSLFAGVVIFHHVLRKDPQAIKWLALGFGISPLMLWLFRHGNVNFDFETERGGMAAYSQMFALAMAVRIPVAGWYYQVPLWCSALFPFAFGVFCFVRSMSGRSLSLMLMGTGLLAYAGRKKRDKIVLISKHFVKFFIWIMVLLSAYKAAYTYCAPKGYLGEAARKKFQLQTKGNKGTLSLLMGGRTAFFSGIYVASKKPVFGFGPWALDTEGYQDGFYRKYASAEDYEQFLNSQQKRAEYGINRIIEGHSHLVTFWLWFGVFGLAFWIYVLLQIFRLFRKNIDAIPIFYGFICAYVPMCVWHIFFSPFGSRLQETALITVVILMNNEGRKRQQAMSFLK